MNYLAVVTESLFVRSVLENQIDLYGGQRMSRLGRRTKLENYHISSKIITPSIPISLF
jgi:hypothetical protein